MPEEKHLPLQRSLTILRHLNQGPADRDTLAEFVYIECDPTAYDDFQSRPGEKMFENDIKRLRELGAEIDFYDGAYHLVNYAGFAPVALSEANLDTLAFLAETFGPDSPNSEEVQQLIRKIADWLPESQRDSLAGRCQRLWIDLRRCDNDDISPIVQATRACNRSPGQHARVVSLHRSAQRASAFGLSCHNHLRPPIMEEPAHATRKSSTLATLPCHSPLPAMRSCGPGDHHGLCPRGSRGHSLPPSRQR